MYDNDPIASQTQILRAINGYDHPYAISIEELAATLGYQSRGAIHRRLQTLRKRGLVNWVDGQSRTLHVTAAGKKLL